MFKVQTYLLISKLIFQLRTIPNIRWLYRPQLKLANKRWRLFVLVAVVEMKHFILGLNRTVPINFIKSG